MVRAPAAAGAATLARAHHRLGVGLHLDMGEWVLREGHWVALYEFVAEGDAAAAVAELERQVALFVELMGKPPDHLDSHQHVHMSRPELSRAVLELAEELGVGVRSRHPRVTYRGMYGQDGDGRSTPDTIGADAYLEAIRNLPAGVTEIGCHPGHVEGLDSDYRLERAIELETLCDPRIRAAIAENGV